MDTPESTTLHTYRVPASILTTNLSSCVGGGGRGPVIPRLRGLERQQTTIQTYTCKACTNSPFLCTNRQHQLIVLLPFKNVEQFYCMRVDSSGVSQDV